jgi:D-alanyl-D-alanine carboxypeptidase (penicillin-binding protein 5/6)
MIHRLIGAFFVICFGLGLSTAQADITTTANHALLMDAQSGEVLWQKDAETPMPPASMSKLMTLELLFQRIKDHRVKLNDTFPVSERAWRERTGSECFVNIGDRMTVESLIQCIIIVSGNDSTIVVAEALGGTVEGFVTMMNARARELGLTQSHFVNPDGLDVPPGQAMSALDLAKLARHIIYTYPDLYHYFGEKDFVWSNIHQPNRNPLLFNTPGADGLKTGHIEASGYGLVGSAIRRLWRQRQDRVVDGEDSCGGNAAGGLAARHESRGALQRPACRADCARPTSGHLVGDRAGFSRHDDPALRRP